MSTMTATARDKREYKQLPKLRTSLKWYKREQLRVIDRKIEDAPSPRFSSYYMEKRAKLRRATPAAYRTWYLQAEVLEIGRAPLSYLRQHLGERLRRVSVEVPDVA